MAEYIKRDAVLAKEIYVCEDGYEGAYMVLVDDIEAIPAADVAPVVHGRWEFEEDARHPWCDKAICTNCKKVIANNDYLALDVGKRCFLEAHNYCPNCGARMDGE